MEESTRMLGDLEAQLDREDEERRKREEALKEAEEGRKRAEAEAR